MSDDEQGDPFEHFAEQEISWSAIGKFRDHLIGVAKQAYAESPDESVGGLILCPGAPVAAAIAQAMPEDRRPDPSQKTCVTAMPRPDFDRFVEFFMPEASADLPEPDPAWRRLQRTLPILIGTANGHRLACVNYDVD